jgi:hypothetical protein
MKPAFNVIAVHWRLSHSSIYIPMQSVYTSSYCKEYEYRLDWIGAWHRDD